MKNQYLLAIAVLTTVCSGNLYAASPSSESKPSDSQISGYKYCVQRVGEGRGNLYLGTCAYNKEPAAEVGEI